MKAIGRSMMLAGVMAAGTLGLGATPACPRVRFRVQQPGGVIRVQRRLRRRILWWLWRLWGLSVRGRAGRRARSRRGAQDGRRPLCGRGAPGRLLRRILWRPRLLPWWAVSRVSASLPILIGEPKWLKPGLQLGRPTIALESPLPSTSGTGGASPCQNPSPGSCPRRRGRVRWASEEIDPPGHMAVERGPGS